MSNTEPGAPGWVQLIEGIQFSHGWLAAHAPDLYAAWVRADGHRQRRSAAAAILRVAAHTESDEDLDDVEVLGGGDPALAVWTDLADRLDRRLTAGPDWLPLAAALSRAEAAGFDVVARLPALVAAGPLPASHPARELHFRLLDDCPPAVAPLTVPVPSGPATAGHHHPQ